MPFPCPYCSQSINIKNSKPGKFKPKCPKCERMFLLVVPAESDESPIVRAIHDEPAVEKPPVVDPHESGAVGSRSAEVTGVVPQLDVRERDDAEPVPPRSAEEEDSASMDTPVTLGGYRIVRELGHGGMGAVYLAEQISLGRPVALKVMNPAWSSDAVFLARFTREAYAAAQLVHHNIVQIYDFDSDQKLHFFSMEFVDGKSLGDLIRQNGKMDIEQAVTYTLQAARGLKFAHDRGMIHRDIKPDNLLLNASGVVKVADLGLVKTPEEPVETPGEVSLEMIVPKKEKKLSETAATHVTQVGKAMGTPAYMSPEQARDATSVDPRADIYSLGCTLYALIIGKPPFAGKTALEIVSQHATAPIVIPSEVLKRLPKELLAILQKMVAKKPEDRYADMGEVAKALEEWLGEKSGGIAGSLNEEQVAKLEDCVKRFNDVILAKLLTFLKVSIVGGCGVLAVLFLIGGFWQWSFGMLFLAAETVLAYFAVSGFFMAGPVYGRARELALAHRRRLQLFSLIALTLFLVILWIVGLLWVWLGVTVLAAAIGFALHYGLDRLVEAERQPIVDDAQKLFKTLRRHGMDEEALRNFVCKFGGTHWEEFYEALFGYEEKLKARDWWIRGQKGQARQKFAAWREPVIAWLEARLTALQESIEKAKLRRLEEQRLKAEGMAAGEARAKAEMAADVLVQCAAEMREDAKDGAPVASKPWKARTARMLRDIEKGDVPLLRKSHPFKMIRNLFDFFLGATIRFVVGAALIAGCLLWMYQNDLIDQTKNIHGFSDALNVVKAGDAKAIRVPLVPSEVTNLFAGYAPGLAGIFLLLSALLPGYRGILLTLLAAFLTFLGPTFGVPAGVCMAGGCVLALLGLLFGGRYRP